LDQYQEPAAVLYLNAIKNIPIHILRIMVPAGAEYQELLPRMINRIDPTLSDPRIFLSLALFILLVGFPLVFRKRSPLAAFLAAFFLVAISPLAAVRKIIGIYDSGIIPVDERWIYLPSVPVFLFIGMIAATSIEARVPDQRRKAAGFGLLVLLGLGLGYLSSIHVTAFGNVYSQIKRLYLFQEEELGPRERMLKNVLFSMSVDLPARRLEAAETKARRALEILPHSPFPYVALAKIRAEQGNWQEVAKLLEPWVEPTFEFIEEQRAHYTKVGSDVYASSHLIHLFYGRAAAHNGQGKLSTALLCSALGKGSWEGEISTYLEENWALNGPAKCLNAADKLACLKKAPKADFPEWRPPLDRDACDRWKERFER